MKTPPLISLIIPIYNSAKYLPACLNSVFNQTYQNLEIILIDDGSTDDSPQIIKKYSQKDSRIKTFHQKNQGLSGARNSGLKIATGEYVTFVDSDDQITPQMIENLVKTLQTTQADISVCSFKELFPSGKTVGFSRHHPPKVFDTATALQAMLKEQGFMVSSTMKLFPTKYFKTIKFPDGKLHEDVGTTYKLFFKATKIAFTPNEDYLYIHHDDSIINKTFDDRKFDLIELTDQMCDAIDAKFTKLKHVTRERRIRARFSLLRQIPLNHPRKQELLNYLKTHQKYITQNPEATQKDKLALKLVLFSPKLFQLAYKLFK